MSDILENIQQQIYELRKDGYEATLLVLWVAYKEALLAYYTGSYEICTTDTKISSILGLPVHWVDYDIVKVF